MGDFGLAIAGTGFIAGEMAPAVHAARGVTLTAVSSRSRTRAEAFTAKYGGDPVEGIEELVARDDVDGVYLAVPTSAKEAMALTAIEAGVHVLVDKPFESAASVGRMIDAARARGVRFMDATHFVHHPRTAAVQALSPETLGRPRTLHSAFYFPALPPDNIRFDRTLEPMGALGDMAWYSMRAVVEYLRPEGELAGTAVAADCDERSGAVVRVSGLLRFRCGACSTFDAGYTANTVIMDLSLYGERGIVTMDDFVLDWHSSSAFRDEHSPTGYVLRQGLATRSTFRFVETPADTPQAVTMFERFAGSAVGLEWAAAAQRTAATQALLDALWQDVEVS